MTIVNSLAKNSQSIMFQTIKVLVWGAKNPPKFKNGCINLCFLNT